MITKTTKKNVILYLCAATEVSPITDLKDVPGAISARLDAAPLGKEQRLFSLFFKYTNNKKK